MRVLLLGAGGMLAHDIRKTQPAGQSLVAMTRSDVDIRDERGVDRTLRDVDPEWVINASAYNDVDGAERDASTAFAVNGDAVGALAALCRERGTALLHYSTDYIFDGTKGGGDFYVESDAPNPLGAYGASKLRGEELIRRSGVRHLIIRTQWLFGAHGRSFAGLMYERAQSGLASRAATDQVGCFTYTPDLARVSWQAIARIEGVYNVANRGRATRYDLARVIFDAAGKPGLLSPCTTADFESAARRPMMTPLHVGRIEKDLGIEMPNWVDAVRRFLSEKNAPKAPG